MHYTQEAPNWNEQKKNPNDTEKEYYILDCLFWNSVLLVLWFIFTFIKDVMFVGMQGAFYPS